MSILRMLPLCGLALLLSSCVELEHPLVDIDKAVADPALLGRWENKEFAVTISPCKHIKGAPAGLLQLQMEKDGSTNDAYVSCAEVGKNRYLQAETASLEPLPVWQKPPKAKALLYKYAVTGDRLDAWFMDEDAVEAEIDAEKLKGNVRLRRLLLDVSKDCTIEETSEDLRRYLAGSGDKRLFPDTRKTSYHRAKKS